jgi:hypothetical protein
MTILATSIIRISIIRDATALKLHVALGSTHTMRVDASSRYNSCKIDPAGAR